MALSLKVSHVVFKNPLFETASRVARDTFLLGAALYNVQFCGLVTS